MMERNMTFLFQTLFLRGYVMRVTDLDAETYQYICKKSPDLPADTLAVSVSCRGTVYSAEALILGDKPYIYQLIKENFLPVAFNLLFFIIGMAKFWQTVWLLIVLR